MRRVLALGGRALRAAGGAARRRGAAGGGVACGACGACGLPLGARGSGGGGAGGGLEEWQQAVFCRGCGGVLPPAAAAGGSGGRAPTHFARLGLEPDFRVSPRELEARLRAAQWLLHPDKFAQACAEERDRSAGQATLVNESVAVLRDPVKRALYMLRLEGVLLGEDAGLEGGGLQLDPEMLLKVMEVREAVEEAEGEELERLSQENDADVHECLSEVAEALSAGRTLEARDAAVRLIYLQRIAEAVKKKE